MIGAAGSTIELVRMLEIGYGLILGPIYGPITAFIGAFIGKMLEGGGFGLFFTPLAAVSAFTAAMIGREEGQSWWVSAGVLIVLISGWYVFETGRIVWYFPAMHLFALFLLVVFRSRIGEIIFIDDRKSRGFGLLLCSFISTAAGHMMGNLIFMVLLAPLPEVFSVIFVVSIIERVGISIGAALFASSLIRVVRKIYPEQLT